MSSENFTTSDNHLFTWNNDKAEDYLLATYLIATPLDGEQAAYGIAKEQSVCATSLATFDIGQGIHDFCAKVVSVTREDTEALMISPLYFLSTSVYGSALAEGALNSYRVVIAYPAQAFNFRLTRIWNNVLGEVHRLGFLASAVLTDLEIPDDLANHFKGPGYGVAGIRKALGFSGRPIFCRSMRPANGLTTADMLTINEQVLSGGFDVIKDDELTYDNDLSPFPDRVERMMAMKRRVEENTGEKKLYFANIIDDLHVALPMLEQAQKAGVDGVLVSSYAQGISFISEIRRNFDLIILAHNTCGDVMTRSPLWGAADSVMAKIHRLAGADLTVGPGPIATPYQSTLRNRDFLKACRGPLGNCQQTLPIIQGGKIPSELAQYTDDLDSTDYMIIAATWLDNHRQGLSHAARQFRRNEQELT